MPVCKRCGAKGYVKSGFVYGKRRYPRKNSNDNFVKGKQRINRKIGVLKALRVFWYASVKTYHDMFAHLVHSGHFSSIDGSLPPALTCLNPRYRENYINRIRWNETFPPEDMFTAR